MAIPTVILRGLRPLSRLPALRVFATGGLLLAAALAQQPNGASLPDTAAAATQVEETRAVLEKWVEARSVASKERRDWALAKETLRDRIDVQRREIASLRQRVAEAETSIGDAEKQQGLLAAEAEQRRATEARLIEQVTALEKRTLELLPRLPEPLREQVRPISQLLPTKPEDAARQRLDERFRNVLYVCKQVHKWNREVTVKSEVRQLADGTAVEVTVVYVGIGQGYYVGNKGAVAGTGTSTPAGWVWTPANDLAAEIGAVVAILKNEKVAAFVRLPVQVL